MIPWLQTAVDATYQGGETGKGGGGVRDGTEIARIFKEVSLFFFLENVG